jgi:AmmeMemoRadiSam system protein A
MTTRADRAALLAVARDAIHARVRGHALKPAPPSGALARCAPAFVTLHRKGALRGCIGHLQADLPLTRVVAQCAAAAAAEDPRFSPVTPAEAAELEIELSILGPLEPVETIDEIIVGRHGLVVEREWRRGLLLPQVATEWRWDAKAFVEQTCQKAGLPRDAWPSGGARLWRFEAEVFGEDDAEAESSGQERS